MAAIPDIRAATEEDWDQIWPFLREIVRAGETYTWPQDVGEQEARRRWMLPSPWRVVVAVAANGVVLGSAKFGPNQEGRGSHVANASFIVDPHQSARGVGRALGVHAVEEARRLGYRAMQFNAVVESNVRAVSLWESLGFEVLATVPEAFDHPTAGFVGLHVMHRRL